MGRDDETTAATPGEPQTPDAPEAVLNKFKAALKAGASVTLTHNGAAVIATIKYREGTFTGYGENAVAALEMALAALPEQ